jgi:hypothetical protein
VSTDQSREKVREQRLILLNAADDNAVFVGGLIVGGLIVRFRHCKLILQFVLMKWHSFDFKRIPTPQPVIAAYGKIIHKIPQNTPSKSKNISDIHRSRRYFTVDVFPRLTIINAASELFRGEPQSNFVANAADVCEDLTPQFVGQHFCRYLNTDLVLLVIIPEIRRRRCSPTVA